MNDILLTTINQYVLPFYKTLIEIVSIDLKIYQKSRDEIYIS